MLSALLCAYNGFYEDENGDKHYDYSDVWTSYASDSLASVFIWIAVALAVVLIGVGVFVAFKKRAALKSFLTVAVSLAVGFAVTVIITMLSLKFFDMKENGAVFGIVLYPSVVLAAAITVGAAVIYVSAFMGNKAKKITRAITLAVIAAAFVALMVCLGVYAASGNAESNNGVTITLSENVVLYICALLILAALLFAALFLGRRDRSGFDTKSIAYAATCIALSFALSYLRLWKMPQGGSVTVASLLPLMVYSYMFGIKKGIFAGFVYGVLQAVQDPWIVHPAQFLLDYPIAFACIGLSGMFGGVAKLKKIPQLQFALGAVIASALRFASHVLSGVFAFSEYSTLDNVWAYSLGYNSFVFVDIAVAIVVGVLLFSSPSFVKLARKLQPKYNTVAEASAPSPVTESVATESAVTEASTALTNEIETQSAVGSQPAQTNTGEENKTDL